MIFYLAARYSRRLELCGYREDLEIRGHVAPARWLTGTHQVHGEVAARAVENGGAVPLADGRLFAEDDAEDILAADVFVAFTEPPNVPGGGRGGRHVEFGFAIGLRQMGRLRPAIVLVGPTENVFYALSDVTQRFPDWAALLREMDGGRA